MTATFLFPHFNKGEKDKVNMRIDVPSEHTLRLLGRNTTLYGAIPESERHGAVPAISSQGFPANRDGVYVFVTRIEEVVEDPTIEIGFTSTATVDASMEYAYPGTFLNGVSMSLYSGFATGGTGVPSEHWNKKHFHFKITQAAKELISILTISKNGKTKEIQFIADSVEGPVRKLAKTDFENTNGGDLIFPVVALFYGGQQLTIIPFNQVTSHSPKIDELMKQFLDNVNKEQESPKQQEQKIKKAPKVSITKPKVAKKTIIKKVAEKKKAPAKKKTAKKATLPTKKNGKKIAKK